MMVDRPRSVDQILDKSIFESIQKPKFLSKKKRDKIASLSKQHKLENEQQAKGETSKDLEPVIDSQYLISHTEPYDPPLKVARTGKNKKFNFDWDQSEDTSADYEPLVTVPEKSSKADDLDVHWSEKPAESMTIRDWRIFKDDFNIVTKGSDAENPIRSWDESHITPSIIKEVKNTFKDPTPIQRAAIPVALNFRDVVGVAETGSGKTLAYALPLLTYIANIDQNYLEFEHQNDYNKALALVLAPTRELALQITGSISRFASILKLNTISIIGGHQYEKTINSISDGVHVIVATPGRLLDSIERGIVSLEKCYYLVLDEADKMINMGFESSIRTILDYLPDERRLMNTIDKELFKVKNRTTLMFTATISPPIERLTRSYLNNAVYLFIGGAETHVERIQQNFEKLTQSNRDLDSVRFQKMLTFMKKHIKDSSNYSIIIFANFKKTCELISQELSHHNLSNRVIHGSKSQEVREKALHDFRIHNVRILIATDIAARGIDVPNVSLVINYHMPKKFDEYVHRIGRTGRAGKSGTSLTFIDDSDSDTFMDLKKYCSKNGIKVPLWLQNYALLKETTLND